MTTNPQSYLAPQSQPWGRFVDKTLADISETTRINTLNTNNNLKQLNSSVNLLSNQQVVLTANQASLQAQQTQLSNQQTQLSNQQNYLATFQTYSSIDSTYHTGYTVNAVTDLYTMYNTFTLSRSSKVLININAIADSLSTYYAPNPNPLARIGLQIYVDGTYVFGGQHGGGVIMTIGSGYGQQIWNGTTDMARVVTLGAGSHTIQASWNYYISGASGYAQIQYAQVIASVIG